VDFEAGAARCPASRWIGEAGSRARKGIGNVGLTLALFANVLARRRVRRTWWWETQRLVDQGPRVGRAVVISRMPKRRSVPPRHPALLPPGCWRSSIDKAPLGGVKDHHQDVARRASQAARGGRCRCRRVDFT
jgi:hypothetical protein